MTTRPDLERVQDVAYAYACGVADTWPKAYAQGRADLADELRRAHAGRLVAALAEVPVRTPEQVDREHAARQCTRNRLACEGRGR